jgi:hypothetical protein
VMKKKKNLRQVGITIPFTDHIQVTNVCSSCLLTGYADLIHTHRFSKHLHILGLGFRSWAASVTTPLLSANPGFMFKCKVKPRGRGIPKRKRLGQGSLCFSN